MRTLSMLPIIITRLLKCCTGDGAVGLALYTEPPRRTAPDARHSAVSRSAGLPFFSDKRDWTGPLAPVHREREEVMANGVRGSELRQIQALYTVGTFAGLGDGPLLERFATLEGEVADLAFAALVARHGPMVWRVCRRVLRDEQDAQDAFQATWLVLVRKAGSLRDTSSVGNWLFGVASRVALDARAASSRRLFHERRYAESKYDETPAEDPDVHDLGAVLHEELRRLPERYRTPIVLCYLEGLSHEEAARRLGRPVGTVRSRLARGRQRLRARLARRGIVPSAGTLTATLACDAGASVPLALVHSTIQAAARFAEIRAATTGAVITAQAVLLCRGVLHTMLWAQLKTIAAVVLIAGTLVATGAGVAAVHARKDQGNDRPASESEKHGGPGPGRPIAMLRYLQPGPRRDDHHLSSSSQRESEEGPARLRTRPGPNQGPAVRPEDHDPSG